MKDRNMKQFSFIFLLLVNSIANDVKMILIVFLRLLVRIEITASFLAENINYVLNYIKEIPRGM